MPGRSRCQEGVLPAVRAVDVSSLRTASSGECVDTSPSSAVRCTISVLRRELRRIVFRAHVVNDTEEIVRCAPGVLHDSNALLQTALDLVCDPHAELGFLFAVPRFGRSGRSAFVRVGGTTFACGFTTPIEQETLHVAALSLGAAALLVAVVAGVVIYERRRRARPSPIAPEPVIGEVVDEVEETEEEAPAVAYPAAVSETMHGIEARGFAAVLDERRLVMGAIECTQRHLLSSDFIAKVVNQTEEPVLCTLSARTRAGVIPVAPGSFRIHPQSAAAVTVPAPILFPWRLRTLHLNMESASLRASAQADVPVPLGVRIAIAALAAFVAAALALAVYRAARPAITGFALPSQVIAGNTATASYALSGDGTGRYAVLSNGARIAGGTVAAGSGSFTFPTSHRPGTYLVTLSMSGPLGDVRQSVAMRSATHLAPALAAIDALAVDPGVAAAGAPVSVRYTADADAGTVSLVGVAGIPLEREPFARGGATTLHAPAVDTPTQYQVALDVTRGTSAAHASVGLLVLPQALATPQPVVAAPAGMMTPAQLLRLPARVVSGRGFTLTLLAHPQRLSIALADARGTALETQSVGGTAGSVRFLAPSVARDSQYFIVARFTTGTADQVLLDPFTIYTR